MTRMFAGNAFGLQRARVLRLDIAAEDTFRERFQQAPLEGRVRHRLQQRQRRDDGEVERAITRRAPVELVDEGIGLADAQRQRQHDARPYAAQHRVDAVADVIEYFRHAAYGMLPEGSGTSQPRHHPERTMLLRKPALDPQHGAGHLAQQLPGTVPRARAAA